MEYLFVAVIIAAVFGICFLVDKGFTRLFRSQAQHQSGKAVRLNKRYSIGGILCALLGVTAIFSSLQENTVLLIGGIIILTFGLCLIVYYLSFGIYYDDDSFLLASFGRKSAAYPYRDIRHQMLYNITGGNLLVELHLQDGRAIPLHSNMVGTEAFLNHAFSRWCVQTGRDPESCAFHDPDNSLWFPMEER